MKKLILILSFAVVSASTFAQSGTLLPNGFQIPRVGSLATCNNNAKGTMVFLTTDNKLYVCNGAAWQGPSEFSIPYTTTVSSNSGGLLSLTNTGSSGVLSAFINNPTNISSAIIGYTSGTGGAAYFYTDNVNAHALRTNGALNFASIGHADGKVLTSDAVGNATWQLQAESAFSVTFSGIPNSAYCPDVYGASTLNFNVENYDIGNDFSLATDKFIAPYNGIYHFDVAGKSAQDHYVSPGGVWYSISIWKNNILQAEASTKVETTDSAMLSLDLKLNQNDYITVKVNVGNVSILDVCFYFQDDVTKNYFNGHLVTRL